ncbi:MAG TPA: 3'-5' exonuclease, partial [Enhygromyxa sp.]|nr:3'-5' exonuclease [Enhygromyxa sp.]
FTTFTRNLAADIDANLKKLCGPEVKRRIEVVHLDKWVVDLLKRAGYAYEIAWWGTSRELEDLWDQAMGLAVPGLYSPSFYRDEWELVVQPAGCDSDAAYRAAARSGRGVRMSRAQKKQVWPVFEEYRNLLEKHGLREPEDALRDATSLLAKGKVRAQYKSVVVDEAQDMSTNAFALLRQVVPVGQENDLFIVGDGHQRIYRKRVALGRAGVNIIGRGRRLRINYRTTDEIRKFAVALLEGVEVDDLDEGDDTTKGYKSLMHGNPPDVRLFESFEAEVAGIVEWVGRGEASRTCLVARTNKLRDQYEAALNKAGIETYRVQRSKPDDPSKPGLRVATMHRVKGLEFERMIIAGVNDDLMPWRQAVERSEDASVKRDAEEMERALFYVAVTRAKLEALVTAHGKPSRVLTTGR